jgi:hypothetical protein
MINTKGSFQDWCSLAMQLGWQIWNCIIAASYYFSPAGTPLEIFWGSAEVSFKALA